MKLLIRIMMTLSLLWPIFGQAAQPELGKYPQVFVSDGYTVTMLRLGKDDSSALIKVDGIDNAFDGQIYQHSKICENTPCTTFKYETKEIPGKARWWTLRSSRPWGEYDSMSFYPPGVDKKHSIGSAQRPDKFDSEKFYQEYLGQKALRK